jgi:hypothetical protein
MLGDREVLVGFAGSELVGLGRYRSAAGHGLVDGRHREIDDCNGNPCANRWYEKRRA